MLLKYIKMTVQPFSVIGISVRTTNENGQSSADIPALWQRFMLENIAEQIPGKYSPDIYCLYTDYEKDHTKPYTTILGCRVNSLDTIPDGLTGITVAGGDYKPFAASGNIFKGAVFETWVKIWNSGLSRAYSTDFEVYGEKATDPENAVVDIFVAV